MRLGGWLLSGEKGLSSLEDGGLSSLDVPVQGFEGLWCRLAFLSRTSEVGAGTGRQRAFFNVYFCFVMLLTAVPASCDRTASWLVT